MEADQKGFFSETQQLVEDYVTERLLLLKLQAAEKTARLTALVVTAAAIGLLAFFILLFVSLMAVYFFKQLTGSWYFGFGIIIAIYVLLAALVIYRRQSLLLRPVSDLVIRIFFEQTEK